MFETKSTFLASCQAIKLGGYLGFSLIKKKRGIVIRVIQQFWIKISFISALLIASTSSRIGFRPLKSSPDIVNAKIFPAGMARPQTAVTSVRSLSGNHLLQSKLIAALYIGQASDIQPQPSRMGQNTPDSAIALIQHPVRKKTQPSLSTQ